MGSSNTPWRRTRVERGIYRQANGKYAVCVMVEGRAPLDPSRRPTSEAPPGSAAQAAPLRFAQALAPHLLDQNLTSRSRQQIRQRQEPICRRFDGRYWARTSDPQLVDSEQRSRQFARVCPERIVERNRSESERLSERERTSSVAIVATPLPTLSARAHVRKTAR
jgi:hypothetical protein